MTTLLWPFLSAEVFFFLFLFVSVARRKPYDNMNSSFSRFVDSHLNLFALSTAVEAKKYLGEGKNNKLLVSIVRNIRMNGSVRDEEEKDRHLGR